MTVKIIIAKHPTPSMTFDECDRLMKRRPNPNLRHTTQGYAEWADEHYNRKQDLDRG
jgi:hypothetical protein